MVKSKLTLLKEFKGKVLKKLHVVVGCDWQWFVIAAVMLLSSIMCFIMALAAFFGEGLSRDTLAIIVSFASASVACFSGFLTLTFKGLVSKVSMLEDQVSCLKDAVRKTEGEIRKLSNPVKYYFTLGMEVEKLRKKVETLTMLIMVLILIVVAAFIIYVEKGGLP